MDEDEIHTFNCVASQYANSCASCSFTAFLSCKMLAGAGRTSVVRFSFSASAKWTKTQPMPTSWKARAMNCLTSSALASFCTKKSWKWCKNGNAAAKRQRHFGAYPCKCPGSKECFETLSCALRPFSRQRDTPTSNTASEVATPTKIDGCPPQQARTDN